MITWLRTKAIRIAWKGPGKRPRLQSIERLSLTPHHSLHLVRVDGHTVLVAVSPSSCSVQNVPVEPEALP